MSPKKQQQLVELHRRVRLAIDALRAVDRIWFAIRSIFDSETNREQVKMPMPAPGEKVLVPTEVKEGAFPGEKLVTVNTQLGPVSGFAKDNFIVSRSGGHYLLAQVQKVSKTSLTVKLFGSFFTTTGVADIPRETPLLKAAR